MNWTQIKSRFPNCWLLVGVLSAQHLFALILSLGWAAFNTDCAFAAEKGLSRINNDREKPSIGAYDKSVALLVGVSDYTNGWPKLESVIKELDGVEKVLVQHGFTVVRVNNPNSEQLYEAYHGFIRKYGYETDNRLLFYFSGHGHSMDDNRKGFLVPADAPHPDSDPVDFKRKALDMNQLISWARQMDSKHGLFIFDSCFSGTIFKQKNLLPKTPPVLDKWASQPVRQFMTAGSAGETVPANSTFTPAFIDAINGKADLDHDGYIIGTELGLYLQTEVSKYVKQTPQYGKIDDYQLSRGDFVFFAPRPEPVAANNIEVAKLNSGTIELNASQHREPEPVPLSVFSSPRSFGIEVNPARFFLLEKLNTSFSGSFSYFPANHNAEFAFPFLYSKVDGKVNSAFSLYTLDMHYRYFLASRRDGIYLALVTRLAQLEGAERTTSITTSQNPKTVGETKLGLGTSLGFRVFARSGVYWGMSLSIGRYVTDQIYKYGFNGDNVFYDIGNKFVDIEFFKFGFAF